MVKKDIRPIDCSMDILDLQSFYRLPQMDTDYFFIDREMDGLFLAMACVKAISKVIIEYHEWEGEEAFEFSGETLFEGSMDAWKSWYQVNVKIEDWSDEVELAELIDEADLYFGDDC